MTHRRLLNALGAVLFFFALVTPWPARADVTDSGAAATVGKATVKLLNPSGLIRVDGLSRQVDALMQGLQPEDSVVLAVYAEPVTWKSFKAGVEGAAAGSTLNFFAIMGTSKALVDQTATEEDFQEFKQILRDVMKKDGAEIMDEQPRALTYRMTGAMEGGAGRSEQITSAVLAEGKILFLNMFSNDQNQFKERFRPAAFGWRDVYLERMKP